MKKWFLILLMLALPATGLATQENEVVTLPTVAPLQMATAEPAADYSTMWLKEYYSEPAMEGEDYQAPHMTTEESERAKTLLKDYQAGTRPAENVLNKLENVVVGVYPLNPEDYEGETLYVLLPVTPLTDEQILEVIDAFAQCGQTFDPATLSYQNCMRGGGIEATRFFQEEERARRNILADLYVRQGFVSEVAYTPLVSDDGLGMMTLDPDAYSGLDSFLFLPARAMTDDELLRYVIYTETGDPAEYGNYTAYEKQLRLALSHLLGAPLTMTLEYENTGVMGDFDVSYGDEKIYYASFYMPDGVYYSGYLDVNTFELLQAWLSWPETLLYSDLHLNPFDEKWLTAAKETVQRMRTGNSAFADAQSMGETRLQVGGYGALIAVIMEDGGYYQFKIAYQNGLPANIISYASHAPSVERMYGVGYEE